MQQFPRMRLGTSGWLSIVLFFYATLIVVLSDERVSLLQETLFFFLFLQDGTLF